jgi:prevent-host-death family protein
MSEAINVHEAKTHFSKLLERVNHGEEIVIAKAGMPVARLIPYGEKLAKRIPGSAKGQIQLKTNFDDPLPKRVLNLFEK